MEFNDSLVKSGVTRALIRFAIPVMLANVLQIVYSTTDLFILGNFATTADVSAATSAWQIMSLVTLGLSGLTSGLTVALGQYYGAKSPGDLAGTVGSATVFFICVAAVLTAPFLIFNHQLIEVMNTPPEAVRGAREYLYICSGGIVFILGFNVLGSVFRGLGSSKLALFAAAVSCVINIALDLLLVAVCGMGAAGAAFATVIAQGGALLLAALYIWRRGLGFKLTRASFKPRVRYISKIIKIGGPISIQEILVTISFLMITAVVNKLGVVASASVGIVERLMAIFTLPTMAMASAVAAMSAHNIGAGQRARAEKCMWSGILTAMCIAVPVCVFCWFFGGLPVSLFKRDPDVVLSGALYLKSYVFDAIGVSLVFIFNSFFSSCGYSMFAMAHSILVTFAVRVPVVILMSRAEGATLFHIGLGAPLASLASVVFCTAFFFYIRRRDRNSGSRPLTA